VGGTGLASNITVSRKVASIKIFSGIHDQLEAELIAWNFVHIKVCDLLIWFKTLVHKTVKQRLLQVCAVWQQKAVGEAHVFNLCQPYKVI
jgi:hypothetical protein